MMIVLDESHGIQNQCSQGQGEAVKLTLGLTPGWLMETFKKRITSKRVISFVQEDFTENKFTKKGPTDVTQWLSIDP